MLCHGFLLHVGFAAPVGGFVARRRLLSADFCSYRSIHHWILLLSARGTKNKAPRALTAKGKFTKAVEGKRYVRWTRQIGNLSEPRRHAYFYVGVSVVTAEGRCVR